MLTIYKNEPAYGETAVGLSIPEGFPWVYPVQCGYMLLEREGFAGGGKLQNLLLYILSGEGEALLEGQRVAFTSDCVLTQQHIGELMLYPTQPTRFVYLLVQNGGSLLEGIDALCALSKGNALGQAMLALCIRAREGRLEDVYQASAAVYALFMELQAQRAYGSTRPSALVRNAMAYIRENFAFLTGIDELAELCGVSKSHLIRRFTVEAGIGPGRYLQQVRIQRAMLLLSNSNYSVELVASLTGYSGANYFCKIFRRVMGESPSRYRRRTYGTAAPSPYEASLLKRMENTILL